MPALGVALTFVLAAFVHTTAGFGAALIAMGLLVPLIGLSNTAPLVAMIVLPLQLMITWRYLDRFAFSTIRDLLLMLLITTPMGILGVGALDEDILLTLLGLLILVYVVYNTFGKQQAFVNSHRHWAVLFGASAGILNGAYNSGGPLIVIYFQSRGDTPDEFRVNVQTTFVVGTVFVILGHILSSRVTADVLRYYSVAVPGMIVGFGIGMLAVRHINPQAFHWIVRGLLMLLGAQLLLT